ncbi:unnamed protein product [Symbiodinium sp. CCMP2456]|nr:unnamed protein product [Symbiodinium sp. CCMP2456]
MQQIVDEFAYSPSSIAARIQHSPHIQQIWMKFCGELDSCPVKSKAIKSLSVAKHRFASIAQPLGRGMLYFEALLNTALWISIHRRTQEEGAQASRWLGDLSEEKILLAAMAADAADETLCLLRHFDCESHDLAESCLAVSTFLSRLHYLFTEGHIFEVPGYTCHILKVLDTSHGFLLPGGEPKTIGGPNKIQAATRNNCLRELRAYVVLAAETLRTEFPDYEVLSALQIFRLGDGNPAALVEAATSKTMRRLSEAVGVELQSLLDEMLDHYPIARQLQVSRKLDNLQAWTAAVLRTQARPSLRSQHPCSNLKAALFRYGAFQGAGTGGIEQHFSRVLKSTGSARGHMGHQLRFDEAKILADGHQDEQELVFQLAQAHWLTLQGPARRSPTEPRLDKGIKKRPANEDSEQAFLRKRRQTAAPLVDTDEVLEAAVLGAEDALLTDAMAEELDFQLVKRYRNMAMAHLAGAVSQADVPEGLLEVAEAMKLLQDEHQSKRQQERAKHHAIMDPLPPKIQSPGSEVWLEQASWSVHLRGLQPQPALHHANLFVVTDAARAPDGARWSCLLNGGSLVDVVFLTSNGASGVAFSFEAATCIRRHVFVSPEFRTAEPALADVVDRAVGKQASKWKPLTSWDEFATTYERLQRTPKQVLALATDNVKQALEMDSVMCKVEFEAFVRRISCTKRGMCGR